MVRLVRLVKLYIISKKVYMRWKGKRATEDEDSGAADGEHEQHESKVGSQLSTRTTNKVIVVVLLMLIVVPIFSYSTNDLTEEFSTDVVHAFNVWHQVLRMCMVRTLANTLTHTLPTNQPTTGHQQHRVGAGAAQPGCHLGSLGWRRLGRAAGKVPADARPRAGRAQHGPP